MPSVLACGRSHLRCVCLLQDGCVSILSPPVPPSGAPTPRQLLRYSTPAEVIACNSSGVLLAVASRVALHVYSLSMPTGPNDLRAVLCFTRPLNAHVKDVAVCSATPGADASSSSTVVGVAGAPGLSLFLGGGIDPAREWTLHPGRAMCGVAFSDDGSTLALASLDGSLFVHGAQRGWLQSPTPLWSVVMPIERVICLDFSRCGRWLAARAWEGDCAMYDCTNYEANEPAAPAAAPAAAAETADGTSGEFTLHPEMRLAGLRFARPPQAAGPALVRWCGAEHAAELTLTSETVRPFGDLSGAPPRHRLRLRDARSGAPRDDVAAVAALPEAELRGLCCGRCVGADGRSTEVALWLDGGQPMGAGLGWTSLWEWEKQEEGQEQQEQQGQQEEEQQQQQEQQGEEEKALPPRPAQGVGSPCDGESAAAPAASGAAASASSEATAPASSEATAQAEAGPQTPKPPTPGSWEDAASPSPKAGAPACADADNAGASPSSAPADAQTPRPARKAAAPSDVELGLLLMEHARRMMEGL